MVSPSIKLQPIGLQLPHILPLFLVLWLALLVAADPAAAVGLDVRPSNPDCVAFDRPPTVGAVAIDTALFLDRFTLAIAMQWRRIRFDGGWLAAVSTFDSEIWRDKTG